jgi:transcriptional repressor NrdR
MRCPFCSHDETQVVETRESDEGDVIRRRRRCGCSARSASPPMNAARSSLPAVVKKDGARVDFDPAKVRASMNAGAAQAPGERGAGGRLHWSASRTSCWPAVRANCPAPGMGELVMRELKRIDKVAYVRFASVYRSFADIDEFKTLVDEVQQC